MNIIGLDLSLTGTAIAYGQFDAEVVATKTDQGDRRLVIIRKRVADFAARADLAVIEDVPPIRAHSLALIGMVHGVVRAALIEARVPYAVVPPTVLKKYATGRGGAKKPDMRMALYQRMRIDDADDNRVDARWLQAMGRDHYGRGPIIKVPQTHRAALSKVAWPTIVFEGTPA